MRSVRARPTQTPCVKHVRGWQYYYSARHWVQENNKECNSREEADSLGLNRRKRYPPSVGLLLWPAAQGSVNVYAWPGLNVYLFGRPCCRLRPRPLRLLTWLAPGRQPITARPSHGVPTSKPRSDWSAYTKHWALPQGWRCPSYWRDHAPLPFAPAPTPNTRPSTPVKGARVPTHHFHIVLWADNFRGGLRGHIKPI